MIGQFGGISFPLDASLYTSSFSAADPARAILMGLFRAAISAELATVWPAVVATLPGGHDLFGSDPIEDTLELAPTHIVMQQRRAEFPLLALHRVTRRAYAPVGQDTQRTQQWHLHHILGPLEVAHARKLLDVCMVVEAIVSGVVANGYHEAYAGGAQQFGPGSPFNRVKLVEAEGPGQSLYGGDESSGTVYWANVITLETVESGDTNTNADGESADPPLDGVTYDAGVSSAEGLFPSVAQLDTDTIFP